MKTKSRKYKFKLNKLITNIIILIFITLIIILGRLYINWLTESDRIAMLYGEYIYSLDTFEEPSDVGFNLFLEGRR